MKLQKVLGIVFGGLFALLLVVVVVTESMKSRSREQRARADASKPTLAEPGMTYKAALDLPGPVTLSDRDEVIKAIKSNSRGLLELIAQGRAKMVSRDETLLVVSRDVSMQVAWVEVRIVEGQGSGKLWLPQWALSGFEHTKP